MKRAIVLSVSVAGLLFLLAVFLVFRQKMAQPGEQFRVRDPGKIHRILFRRDTSWLELRRRKDVWLVNGRWKVRPRAIKVLKKTLEALEVRSPLSEDLAGRFLEDTASVYTCVNIYGTFLPLKRFEALLNTGIPGGNMMRLKGKKEWYILQLPGEEINPATLFVVDPYYWRDLTLFHFLPGEVTEVEIRYREKEENGFRTGIDTLTGEIWFIPFDSSEIGKPVDTARVKKFLTYFQKLTGDAWDRTSQGPPRDSLLRQKPLYEVSVGATRHRVFRMRIYPLPAKDVSSGDTAADPDIARVWVEPLDEMILIKYYRIDPFLFKTEDFFTENE